MQKIEQEPTRQKCICSYSRVSTNSEEQEGSYLLQKQYWEEKLGNLPNTKYIGTFADKGSGKKIIQRKEFCRMIDLAMAGFIDAIYTKSIYRFARNTSETLRIVQELQSIGVAVIFEEENINTLQLSNQVFMHLKALFAEEEINQMSKNVSFMARERFSQGIPDRKDFYGYKVVDEQYVIVEEEAKVVQLIFALFLKGHGVISITKQLQRLQIKSPMGYDTWNKSTLEDILRNEKYKGDLLLQKSFYTNGVRHNNNGELPKYYVRHNHEPIIDAEVFDTVQEIIKNKGKPKSRDKQKYDFTGKLFCSCGGKFKHKINTRIVNFERSQWVCSKKDTYGAEFANCSSMPIPNSLLEEITLDAYNQFIDTPYEIKAPKELQEELLKLEKLQFTINKFYSDNLISIQQYKEEKNKILERRKELSKIIQEYDILSIYEKPQNKAKQYNKNIIDYHIESILIDGFKIIFKFKNGQEITKEYKHEHRKYSKAY